MKRLLAMKIYLSLFLYAISFPTISFSIDLDSLMTEPPPNETNCLKIVPHNRILNKECQYFNDKIGIVLTITKEDLFDAIRQNIKATNELQKPDLTFNSDTESIDGDIKTINIKGQELYACDVFASVFVNSYGFTGDPDGESVYYVCNAFSEFTIMLASFYEEKHKNPNASPDAIVNKMKAWNTGDDSHINSYLHRDNPYTVKTLLAFAKDYDKFLESIIPEYYQKIEQMERSKQTLLAKQKEQQRQKDEERRQIEEEQKLRDTQRINNLLAKWSTVGIPQDMLSARLRTYASGDLCTLVELIDNIPGLQKCTKKNELWMCYQKTKDEMIEESNEIRYGFYDRRKAKGYIWLDRVVVNGQDINSVLLTNLVLQLLGK